MSQSRICYEVGTSRARRQRDLGTTSLPVAETVESPIEACYWAAGRVAAQSSVFGVD